MRWIPCVLILASTATAVPPSPREIVETLASDELAGRGLGQPELSEAGGLLVEWLEEAGVEPGAGEGWRQELDGPSGEELFNVVGRVEGRSEEWIVVGAHYDGLGRGAPGTDDEGEILNGADDNASGVAALVRIAAVLASAGDLARSVYVVGFTGEETGLLGSRAFVADPPTPLENAVAMINLDTVGRMENDRLVVFGTGTAEEFPEILRGVNYGFGFDLALNEKSLAASDHAPFLEKGVPVLHLFTGANADYHRSTDDAQRVSFPELERLADFTAEIVTYLATTADPLTFRPPGVDQAKPASAPKRRRVSFGSIPDFSQESGGILLSGVVAGSAAQEAGLTAGDRLVEIDGMALETIYDFQAVLAERAPGDVVTTVYERDGERHTVEVTLKERK